MADSDDHRDLHSDRDRGVLKTAKDAGVRAATSVLKDALTKIVVAAAIAIFLFLIWQPLTHWWQEWRVPAMKGTHFSILVAQLEGDTDGSQTRHVIQSLEEQFAHTGGGDGPMMHIIRYPAVLEVGDGEVSAALEEAQRKGRKWLASKKADLLLWGSVAAKDRKLRLRFLAREGKGGAGAKPYDLSEKTLELSTDFGADFGAVVAATAATGIQPVYERSGEALAELIAPVVRKLKPLAENPPASFDDDSKARLWHAYAIGEQRLGEEKGDNARLATAIAFFRKVLGVWTREKVPLLWATAQNNLGLALLRLGERESGTARLEEAVTAYRAALEERTREKVPLDWAATQNNLGNALRVLGERESGTARLEEAVKAYRAALEEYTREKVPLQWAMMQNNLGTALATLGERESGTARLEEAVTAYRAALEERTREKVPLDWAATQNNLGNTLATFGERESGTARLEEAVKAYRATLEERTREKVPLQWAMTQNNFGLALATLGGRESGTARLEEAVQAYRAALEERMREKVPLDWAMTQENLGLVLQTLGERQAEQDRGRGCATLAEARQAIAGALEVYRVAPASYYIGGAEGNLADIDAAIARLSCGG